MFVAGMKQKIKKKNEVNSRGKIKMDEYDPLELNVTSHVSNYHIQ